MDRAWQLRKQLFRVGQCASSFALTQRSNSRRGVALDALHARSQLRRSQELGVVQNGSHDLEADLTSPIPGAGTRRGFGASAARLGGRGTALRQGDSDGALECRERPGALSPGGVLELVGRKESPRERVG